MFEERRRGRTVLFSSHVLSDVEALCNRVVILHKGRVVERGTMRELVNRSATMIELTLRGVDEAARARLSTHGAVLRALEIQELVLEVEGEEALTAVLAEALATKVQVVSAVPRKDSLDLFVRKALGTTADAAKLRRYGAGALPVRASSLSSSSSRCSFASTARPNRAM